ncbi:MAG: dCTP deaminase [Pirellulales bacterium]
MGILSKQAIERRLKSGELKISPAPKEENYDSDAVDVHLGENVYEWTSLSPGTTISISLWKNPPNEFSYKAFSKSHLKDVLPDNAGIITLRPHTFYLADLQQHTTLPVDVAMHVQGKSSLARLGMLVHLTAPHAHAGWTGRLTLEIYNLGPFNIEMKPGMTIGQLTFWKVEEPGDIPPGQFDDQKTARGT